MRVIHTTTKPKKPQESPQGQQANGKLLQIH